MSAALEVSVRSATEDDLAFVASSHRLAHVAIQDARGGELETLLNGRQEPIEDSWSLYLSAGEQALLIGELDGVSVGYCALEHLQLVDQTSIAMISELWVHPDARGVGVGAALMHHIEATAHEWGARGLDSRALPGDRTTKNFFESFGLVARSIHVHRTL